MVKEIKIHKGLDIKLIGEAKKIITYLKYSKIYAVNPSDFNFLIPKLLVKEGEFVKIGTPLFCSKQNQKIVICSPVSGQIDKIIRGDKRKILNIYIKKSYKNEYIRHKVIDINNCTADEIKNYFCSTGIFVFFEQRPYGILANPLDTPKEIIISGINSSPLAPDIDFILKNDVDKLQLALNALNKLTTGKVHVIIKNKESVFSLLKNIEIYYASGPHPIGNVSIHIEKINPINKGEKIWKIRAEDLSIIGQMLDQGTFNLERIVAVSGSRIKNPHYVKVISGAPMIDILDSIIIGENNRIIDGNVLTGKTSSISGFIGYKTNHITVIPEGNDYEFLGWQFPHSKKFSITRALMFSFLNTKKKYDLNTNTNGEFRPFVLTGYLDKVFPQNIYPLELIKSVLTKNIDMMEKLGIYEVVPEDFALTEFIDVSKNNHQEIIQEGINLMIKEVG